jgi:hypothetical protein
MAEDRIKIALDEIHSLSQVIRNRNTACRLDVLTLSTEDLTRWTRIEKIPAENVLAGSGYWF